MAGPGHQPCIKRFRLLCSSSSSIIISSSSCCSTSTALSQADSVMLLLLSAGEGQGVSGRLRTVCPSTSGVICSKMRRKSDAVLMVGFHNSGCRSAPARHDNKASCRRSLHAVVLYAGGHGVLERAALVLQLQEHALQQPCLVCHLPRDMSLERTAGKRRRSTVLWELLPPSSLRSGLMRLDTEVPAAAAKTAVSIARCRRHERHGYH
jgi:hypothetical protein